MSNGTVTLQPHQQRVLAEANELSDRVVKLGTFIAGDKFTGVPAAEKDRLITQLVFMRAYLGVLNTRLDAFGRAAENAG